MSNASDEPDAEVVELVKTKLEPFIPTFFDMVSVASVLASASETPLVRTPVTEEPSPKPKETKALKSARRGLEKLSPNKTKTSKITTPKNRDNEKDVMKRKDIALSQDPFAPHIRYFGLTPDYRGFLFAQAFSRIVKEQFRWRKYKVWSDALIGEIAFRHSKDIYHFITKARIEADYLHARYEDFVIGICRYYHDLNMKGSGEKIPRYDHLSGVEHVHAAHSYLTNTPKILMTLEDISFSENADFLLPGRFASGTLTPHQYELSLIFFHDVVFPELERMALVPGYSLKSVVDIAIRYGLLPLQWAEGYGTFHRLERLATYKYKSPEYFIPESVFKSIM